MGKYFAIIKTKPQEEQLKGFGGSASFEFTAELTTEDGQSLGTKTIFFMGRSSALDKLIPNLKCILFLKQKDDEYIFEGDANLMVV